MIEVSLIKVEGRAAIVAYRDDEGDFQARIISVDEVAGLRLGETKKVSRKMLVTGTEYGIDWDVLLGDEFAITPSEIGQSFRKFGLWTYDDMNRNPAQVNAALNAVSRRIHAYLLREARQLK
jgi:hypothetical protein